MTPAAPESGANDAEKAELRAGLIKTQMALLRTVGRYKDADDAELWDKAADVFSATCQLRFGKPLHDMKVDELKAARVLMDEAAERKLGATA